MLTEMLCSFKAEHCQPWLPARLSPRRIAYYVRDVSGATYKLARTLGGAAIDFTDAGAALVIGCCNFEPGNSVFVAPYVLWNFTGDAVARSLRGIRCHTVNPVYGGNTHQGNNLNYTQFVRPQVNMFQFTGALAGCDRINLDLEGTATGGGMVQTVINGFVVSGGDLEGKNQHAIYCNYVNGSHTRIGRTFRR